ncbi:MAG: hypothetical protein P8J50_04185 [Acidimicrobiales bacterium]|nr:hypothetical protein [Acidimicrobiales bacterium]
MRRWMVLAALSALAVLGAVLIITADDDEAPPELETVTTAEGIVTQVPLGWAAEGDFIWDYHPAGEPEGFDQWTVTTAGCLGDDDCPVRTLEEWLEVAPSLATFVGVRSGEGSEVFGLREEQLGDAYVMRARTESSGDLVFVAAFTDSSWDSFYACSVRLGFGSDRRLATEIVDVCRETADGN